MNEEVMKGIDQMEEGMSMRAFGIENSKPR
jgi:hypothetical protein